MEFTAQCTQCENLNKMLLRFFVKSIFDFYLFDLKALKIAKQHAQETISRKNEQKKETYFTHSASKALVNSLWLFWFHHHLH